MDGPSRPYSVQLPTGSPSQNGLRDAADNILFHFPSIRSDFPTDQRSKPIVLAVAIALDSRIATLRSPIFSYFCFSQLRLLAPQLV